MRTLHLAFRLHRPYVLREKEKEKGLFDGEKEFREANTTEYQPLFALLERNTQRFKSLRVSLVVTGPWLDQAEKFDPGLVQRLRDLVKTGQVEIIAEPYGHSLAAFYDVNEFVAQVGKFLQRAQILLGVECRAFCMPELIYNDKIARWAAERGFVAVLAGSADKALGWRSANYVYKVTAANERAVGVLFQQTALSRAVRKAEKRATIEVVVDDEASMNESQDEADGGEPMAQETVVANAAEFARAFGDATAKKKQLSEMERAPKAKVRQIYSAVKFQKELELACLRGSLINLYLDSGIFRAYREQKIVGFFDELFANWLKSPSNRFSTATEVVETLEMRPCMAVKTTVDWRTTNDDKNDDGKKENGLTRTKDVHYGPPEWLRAPEQVKIEQELYAMRVGAYQGNTDLKADFARLTNVDFVMGMSDAVPALIGSEEFQECNVEQEEGFKEAVENVRARIPILKLAATANEAKAGASEDESVQAHGAFLPEEDHSVPVHRVKKAPRAALPEDEEAAEMDEWQQIMSNAADDAEAELQVMVQRSSRKRPERQLDDVEEAEVVEYTDEEAENKTTKTTRRFLKKLVIE